MATKSQIGAVISLEGADVFSRTIRELTNYTRAYANEMKALSSAFDGQNRTIEQNNQYREVLKKNLDTVADKLKLQKEALKEATEEMKKNGEYASGDQVRSLQALQNDVYKTTAEYNKLNNELKNLPSNYEIVKKSFQDGTKIFNNMGNFFKDVGSAMTKTFTVPFATIGTLGVKAYTDWESAFAGVKKTVNEVTDANGNVIVSYDMIADSIRNISMETASTPNEVAAVAEAAGQLGITANMLGNSGVTELEKFTKTMVMLGDSTDLSANDAAIALARVLNITGESTNNIDRIGAAIVELGNNFATSESEIVAMTNRLAAGGTIAGLSTQDILGLAAAMSSVGITAEAGGTAMNQTLTAIEKEFAAFSSGAESKLPRIAEIAGMSAEQFASAWENEPITAVQAFIGGLGGLDEKGESATLVLDELGMAGIRQSNMLKSLSLASDVLTNAVDKSNKAYNDNNALTDEAKKRYETLQTKFTQLKSSLEILGQTIGEYLLPFITQAVEGLTNFIIGLTDFWNSIPQPIQDVIFGFATFLAVAGPIISFFGNIIIFAGQLTAALTAMGTTWGAVGGIVAGIVTGPLGWIVGAIAAIIAITKIFNIDWATVWENVKSLAVTMFEVFIEGWHLMIEDIKTGINNIKTFFANLWENFKNGWNNIKTFFSNLWKWVVDDTTKRLQNLKNDFNSLKDKVGEIFTNLKNSAINWGKDLISNFVSGITSRIGKVTSAIGNIAGTVKSYLGFSEPDKGPLSNFHTYMPDMLDLMAQGIYQNAYKVEDALGSLATNMANSSGQSFNYGGVVINLNVPEGANGRQLVDQIENELANRTIRRKAVFA